MKPAQRASTPSKKYPPGSFMGRLKERKIIATLAAFAGSGVVIIELAHHILVNHYHFPHQIVDFCIVTLVGALIGTLTWRWFRGAEKKPGNVKVEVLVVPLIILLTLVIDLKFIFVMTDISINMLLIGIVAICLGIAWVVFKSLQWAAYVPELEKKVEVLKPTEEKPIGFSEWKNSIGVLPFTNISADPEQEYFCDGISEEIINRLTQIKDFRVIARTSAFAFKGKQEDIREIGRKLDVETVLEGSVRKSGQRLRITAQLINVSDGYHLWSERFDRNMDDIFAIQDDISLAIVDILKLKLIKGEKTKLVKRHTGDPEAYNFYLKGRYFYNKRTEEGFHKSIESYKQAVKKDPNFALPYAGLADTYLTLGFYELEPMRECYEKAKQEVMKALEMDDTVGEPHNSMGIIKAWYEFDWEGAEAEFKKALELSPSDVEAHHMYAHCMEGLGRFDEALAEMKKALELEPLSIILNTCLGHILCLARRSDEAIDQFKKSIEMDPSFPLHYYWLGRGYLQKGMVKQSVEMFKKAATFPIIYTMGTSALGYAYGSIGEKDKAKKILDELLSLSDKKIVDSFYIALVYLGLDDRDKTFEWLEKAYEDRSMYIAMIDTDQLFDDLREDRRFVALLNKMGLEK